MTPHDYDYLRRLLKTRSGLVLSRDKAYLLESRLMPVAAARWISAIACASKVAEGRGGV